VRALAIEGALPTADAFAQGAYAAGTPVLLVTFGPPHGAAAEIAARLQRGDCALPPGCMPFHR
jgi:hypothetical protein